MYHVSRLREDAHAQWDIQNISRAMSRQAKEAMPLTFAFIGGKDKYNQIYESLYGELPKVKEAAIKALDKYGTGCSGSRYLTMMK